MACSNAQVSLRQSLCFGDNRAPRRSVSRTIQEGTQSELARTCKSRTRALRPSGANQRGKASSELPRPVQGTTLARTRQSDSTRCTHTLPPWHCNSTTSSRVYERGLSMGSKSTCSRARAPVPPKSRGRHTTALCCTSPRQRDCHGCRTRSRIALYGCQASRTVYRRAKVGCVDGQAETAGAQWSPRRRPRCARWPRRLLVRRRA